MDADTPLMDADTPLMDADINLTLTLTLTQGCRVVTPSLTVRSTLTLLATLRLALSRSPTLTPTLTLTLRVALSSSGLIAKRRGYLGLRQQPKFVGRIGRAASNKGGERSGFVCNGTLVVVVVVAGVTDLRVKGALDDAGL